MEPSDEKILEAVREILKGADLNTISAKKVRHMLEEQFGVDLTERKKSIGAMTLDVVDELSPAEEEKAEESAEDGDDGVVDVKPAVKRRSRAAPSSKTTNPPLTLSDRPARAAAPKPKKRRVKAEVGEEGTPTKRSSGSYGALLDLSPELAEVMGESKMRRSDVVKQMWAVIRERNLKDPKDGRYHICDEQLFKVFGVKRVQTFGMMKYLKTHMT